MDMIGNISRRALLRNGTSAASLLVFGLQSTVPGYATTSPSLDAFIAMSENVNGQSPLDLDMGRKILEAFLATGQVEDLVRLVADPTPERNQSKIVNAVVAAWYSGLSPLPGAREVTGFNEALVWNALSYTKPWGNCGGEMGYWADLPAGEEP